MSVKLTYYTNSPEETKEIGKELARLLNSGDIVALNGDLGAGKTAFTQGLAVGLGITEYVTSPTFTIMNIYESKLPLYHYDVYRISEPEEMDAIGFNEYLFGEGVCVIEWSDIIQEILPERIIDIRIYKTEEQNDSRRIEITMPDELAKLMEVNK